MNHRPFEIAIIGAGVVGLAVAALLATGPAAERIHIRVLEAGRVPRWRRESLDLRVYALSRASQRVLERVGAWEAVRTARACPYRRMRVFEGESPQGPASLDFDSADVGEPDLGHIVEDSLLRSALLEVLAAHGNVEVRESLTLEGGTVGERDVTLKSVDGAEMRAGLVIAADGSDSLARGWFELPAFEHRYGQMAVVTHVASTLPHRETAWQRFLPGGPLALLPLADGSSSVVWSLPEAEAQAQLAAADAEFGMALTVASMRVLGDLMPRAPRRGFPLRALHAPHYCSSRIVLIGDAAHTVHPLAGQGMNLGIGDASTLAATLANAVAMGEDPGDRRVLRRYERARKGANLSMLLALDALHRLFGPTWAAPLRAVGLRTVDAAGPLKRRLISHALGANGAR